MKLNSLPKKLATICATAFLTLGMLSSAQAANVFVTKEYEGTHAIYFTGDIRRGDAKKLEAAIFENPNIKNVVMWSNGGIAAEGPLIGSVLSKYEMTAVVKENTWCMSACADAFIGAAEYKIDGGVLGFHKAWIPPFYRHRIGSQEAFDNGQSQGANAAYWLIANGFSFQLSALINHFTAPDKFVVFFHEDSLKKFYVRDEANSVDNYLKPAIHDFKAFEDFNVFTVDRLLRVTGNK